MIIAMPAATTPQFRRSTLLLFARLRRFFNRWAAATTIYREQQATLCAGIRRAGRELDRSRIYRGPIDAAVEKAAQFRLRRRLE